MRRFHLSTLCALGAASFAGGAWAGGYVAPVAAPVEVAPVVEVAPASDWAGGYAGASLGYSFGADDEVGLDFREDGGLERNSDIGAVDIKGPTAGLHAGYRWQRGNWVFGPELWVEGGSVDARDDLALDDFSLESQVNYIVGLQMKTGYAVNSATLVYGTAGAVHGDFDYTLSTAAGSQTQNYDASGYSLGLGVERKLNPNLSVFAEWQYRNFGKTDVTFSEGGLEAVSRATPEHHNVKVGINFSF